MSVSRFYVITDCLGVMHSDGEERYVTGFLDERHELESDIKYAAKFCSLERADEVMEKSSRKFFDPMIYLVESRMEWEHFSPTIRETFTVIETFDRVNQYGKYGGK